MSKKILLIIWVAHYHIMMTTLYNSKLIQTAVITNYIFTSVVQKYMLCT